MKSQFQKKYIVLLMRIFHLSSTACIQECDVTTPYYIIQFKLYYLPSGNFWEVKNKKKIKLVVLKEVTLAYESWMLARGSKYSTLEIWSLKRGGPNQRFHSIQGECHTVGAQEVNSHISCCLTRFYFSCSIHFTCLQVKCIKVRNIYQARQVTLVKQ